jgi:methylenetetrahydrofolate--tRNA-(uracil-5-)-methyltransferase
MTTTKPIHVIGGGLAGSEAAWQAAEAGVPVILHEMRPVRGTEAHKTEGLAELVCSNSFRSDDAQTNAVGLLHAEMRLANSLIMASGDAHQVPAGSALAVDRDGFSDAVTAKLEAHPLVTIVREEVAGLPPADWDQAIIATGPLTAPSLAEAIARETGADALAFFDAIAPIVHFDTIDMDVCWFQSRYDKVGPGGTGKDYINCPMDKAQYEAFVQALIDGQKTQFKEWEDTPYFDGCLPIEIMAERGAETLRHGPMKPMGLTNAHNPTVKAYAVVQLRQDNALGTLYNMVGFQTKLKHGEQTRIFRMIPGLENAEFARLGGLHRNTYINSPTLLDGSLQLKSRPGLRFAGQIHRPLGRALRRRRAARQAGSGSARHDGVRRAAQPHHRRTHRLRRRARQAFVPADERQFRPVPAAGARHEAQAGRVRGPLPGQGQVDRQEESHGRARLARLPGMAGCRAALAGSGRVRLAIPAACLRPTNLTGIILGLVPRIYGTAG